MANNKMMGTEYQIVAEGSWEEVVAAVKTTKKAIEETQPAMSHLTRRDNELENKVLTAYLVPNEEESFADYKARFVHAFVGEGLKGKIASLFLGRKVPFEFYFVQNDGESTIRVDTVARAGKYQATISVSGEFAKRGAEIAETLKGALEEGSVSHTYKSLEKLI